MKKGNKSITIPTAISISFPGNCFECSVRICTKTTVITSCEITQVARDITTMKLH